MQHKPAYTGAPYTEIKQFPKKPKPKDLLKEWYIYFHFQHDGTWCPVRKKGDINRIKTFKEKEKELHALKSAMIMTMDRGWNPITKRFPTENVDALVIYNQNMSITEALTFAHSKCQKLADTTYRAYGNCIEKVKVAIKSLGIEFFPMKDVKKRDIKVILDKTSVLYRWTDQTYNKNLGYLQGVISHLLPYDIIEYNPAHKIEPIAITERKPKFVPYSKAEKKKIADYLYLHQYGFYVYIMTLYHTGIRPMEVLALKIKDLDFQNTVIDIVPDRNRRNSKTKKRREVQMDKHLLPLLREWVEGVANRECYVFGSPYESGKGNKGSSKGRTGDGASHPDYFKPSMTRIKRDTVTKHWNKIVMQHLGIKKYQYAAKHTGCDDKLLAGIPLEAIKDMFGHTDEFMTKRYQTVLKKLRRQEINEKSPAFVNLGE